MHSILMYFIFFFRYYPGSLEAVFDSCLVTNTRRYHIYMLEVMFNFVLCTPSTGNNQLGLLWDIVEFGHSKILKHPLCEAYLTVKWTKVRKYFYIQFMFYFLYASLTTLLTFDKYLDRSCEIHNKTINQENNKTIINYVLPQNNGNNEHRVLQNVLRIIIISLVLVQTTILIFNMGLEIILSYKSFKFSFWNALHIFIALFVLLVILPFENVNVNVRNWQRHGAAILNLALWLQCMLLVGRIPSCGIYVAMYSKVLGDFVRILAVYFSLILAFTFSFHISEHFEETCSTIPNVILTFLKALTMMVGELDYNDKFVERLNTLPGTTHIIFLLFVLLVAIILSNLLVALAVNDVQVCNLC